MIDSSDIYRIYDDEWPCHDNEQCQGPEFHAALNESRLKELDVPLLIFANKCDLPDSEPILKILEKLEAHKIEKKWFIQLCSAKTKEGLWEGIKWIVSQVEDKEYVPPKDGEEKTWMIGDNYRLKYKNRDKSDIFMSGWIRNNEIEYEMNVSFDCLHKLILQFYGW